MVGSVFVVVGEREGFGELCHGVVVVGPLFEILRFEVHNIL